MSATLRSFSRVRRVIVTEPSHPLVGKTGTVHRFRRCDDGAWVRMDEPLPDDLRSFPALDERGNDFILFPAECAAATEPVMSGNILHHTDGSQTVVIPAGNRVEPDNAALVAEARDNFAGRSTKGITINHARALLERLDDVSEDYRKKLEEAEGDVASLRVMVDELHDDVRDLRSKRGSDARYIERLERANSTLHQALAEEQREREQLVEAVGNAMGELSEFFRQANRLRGRGTPRRTESVGLPPTAPDGNGARAHSPTAPASTTHEPRYQIATGE